MDDIKDVALNAIPFGLGLVVAGFAVMGDDDLHFTRPRALALVVLGIIAMAGGATYLFARGVI